MPTAHKHTLASGLFLKDADAYRRMLADDSVSDQREAAQTSNMLPHQLRPSWRKCQSFFGFFFSSLSS